MGTAPSSDAPFGARMLAVCPPAPPRPSDEEVHKQFDVLLCAKNIPAATLKQIADLESPESKWMYIHLSEFITTLDSNVEDCLKPQTCIKEILDMQLDPSGALDLFRAIRINMVLQPKEWVNTFVAVDGVKSLVSLLNPNRRPSPVVYSEVVNVLIVLSSCESGLRAIVESQECCSRLFKVFVSATSHLLQARILALFGSVATHSIASREVIGATLDSFNPVDEVGASPFCFIVKVLLDSQADSILSFAIVNFVNTWIRSTSDESHKQKIHAELEKLALVPFLETFQSTYTTSSIHATDVGVLEQVQILLSSHSAYLACTGGFANPSDSVLAVEHVPKANPSVPLDCKTYDELQNKFQQNPDCETQHDRNSAEAASPLPCDTNLTPESTMVADASANTLIPGAGSRELIHQQQTSSARTRLVLPLANAHHTIEEPLHQQELLVKEHVAISLESTKRRLSGISRFQLTISPEESHDCLKDSTSEVVDNVQPDAQPIVHPSATKPVEVLKRRSSGTLRSQYALPSFDDEAGTPSHEIASAREATRPLDPPFSEGSTKRRSPGLVLSRLDVPALEVQAIRPPATCDEASTATKQDDSKLSNPEFNQEREQTIKRQVSGGLCSPLKSPPVSEGPEPGVGSKNGPQLILRGADHTSFEGILSKLQQTATHLDERTQTKLLSILSTLTTSLSDGSMDGSQVVDRCEKSLCGRSPVIGESIGLPFQIGIPALTDHDNTCFSPLASGTPGKTSVTKKPSRFQFFANGIPEIIVESPSCLPTPTKHASFTPISFPSTSPIHSGIDRSPVYSQSEEERSPRRSMTETESCDESYSDIEPAPRKSSGPKLALAGFFQHLKRGQALPSTPATTPMATASVKKDAKRYVFPSFPVPSAASPGPRVGNTQSFALPPMTPRRQSLSLPPLTPRSRKSSFIPPDPVLSPVHGEQLTAVMESDIEPLSPMRITTAQEQERAVTPVPSNMDSTRNSSSNAEKVPSAGELDSSAPANIQIALGNPVLGSGESFSAKVLPPETSSALSAPVSVSSDISKFRKLLSMGAPLAAVQAKMRQAGFDPALLDQRSGFCATSAAVSAPVSTVASSMNTTGDDVSKFKKLLSMGAPLEAVKAKMRQAGVDPSLLDDKQVDSTPGVPLSDLRPGNQEELSLTGPTKVKDHADYAKFFKLLSMRAPAAAVKAKMTQAGLDPDLLDTPDAFLPCANTPSANTATPKVLVKDSPEYAKFFKLRSMGAPVEAVKGKIRQAGLNPDLLDTPDAEMPSKDPDEKCPSVSAPVVLVKDDPDYAKFFKLRSMGAPAEAVKAKMRQAGLNPDLLDTPDAEVPGKASSTTNTTSAEPKVTVKDDPNYAKYFKLHSMGAPAEAVKTKMRQAGLNPDLLDTPDAYVPDASSNSDNQAGAAVLVKDDPEYAKFFKLCKMGASAEIVKTKMQMAGLRPELLDTPDAVLPSVNANNQASNNNPAPSRRANLSLSIKPPTTKPLTRAFYWQKLKGEAIQGTIWAEIETDKDSENNSIPLLLADGDLALLEAEFPAQTAPMTGPGTMGKRGRSTSMDQGMKEPSSPRVVFLIERSRSNNISITIKQFRMSHAAIREAIMKGDPAVLTIERVQGLIKILPTDEEVAAVMGFKGDITTLNEAERILKELITVPRLKQRLGALQAKLQFPTLVKDVEEKIDKLSSASRQIAQSSELKMILATVLQVGNKMNQGTTRAGAAGFQLSDLIKLGQLKGADKSVTLLHFIARMLRQKKEDLVHLGDSLSSLYDVQNIPIAELPGDMNKIAEIVDCMTNELGAQTLKNAIEEKESCDQFVSVMSKFLENATDTVRALKESMDIMFALLKETMTRFGCHGDDDSTSNASLGQGTGNCDQATLQGAGEFFATFYEFSVALKKADRENEAKRLREETRLRQLKAKAAALGQRSMSSRDLGTRKSISLLPKVSAEEGPETPEPAKTKETLSPPSRPTLLRVRSASLSALSDSPCTLETESLGVSTAEASESLPPKLPLPDVQLEPEEVVDTAKSPEVQDEVNNDQQQPICESKATAAGSGFVSKLKPPTKFVSEKENEKVPAASKTAAVNPEKGENIGKREPSTPAIKEAAMSTPKPVIRSTSLDKKIVPPPAPSVGKTMMKAGAFDQFTAFDSASIEEIRSQLAKKHGSGCIESSTSESVASKGARKSSRGNNNEASSPGNPATTSSLESSEIDASTKAAQST